MQKCQLPWVLICLFSGFIISAWVVSLYFVIDADISNSPTVWHEITQHGWPVMKNWLPTPDNWYFSAYPVHFIIYEILGTSSPEIILWISTFQIFICSLLAALICYERSKNIFSFILVPIFCGLGHYAQNVGYLAHPFSHNLTNLYGLLCIYLYLINLRRCNLAVDILIYVLIIIASVSDPWLLAAFYLPFLLTTVYEVCVLKTRNHRALIIPMLTGVILFSHTIERLFGLPTISFHHGTFLQSVENAYWLLFGLGGLLNMFVVEKSSTFIVSALVILTAYFTSIRNLKKISNIDFLTVMSVLGITSAFIISDVPGAYYSGRFLVNILYLTVIVIFLRALSGRKILWLPITMIIISSYITNLQVKPVRDDLSKTEGLLTFLRNNHLNYGYGPYWGTEALAISWISNFQQIIRPVTFNKSTGFMESYGRMQTFTNWYEKKETNAISQQFIAILNDGEECRNVEVCLEGVKKQFGMPEQILTFKSITFYVYNKPLNLK